MLQNLLQIVVCIWRYRNLLKKLFIVRINQQISGYWYHIFRIRIINIRVTHIHSHKNTLIIQRTNNLFYKKRYLVVFLKDIDTPEVVRINQSLGFSSLNNLVQGFKIIILEFNSLKVRFNTRRSDTLGDNRVSTLKTPRNEDLSRRNIVLFSNLDNIFVLEQRRISTTKRRISSNYRKKELMMCCVLQENDKYLPRIPWSLQYFTKSSWGKKGCNSTWLAAGTIFWVLASFSSLLMLKLLTPMARALLLSSFSMAYISFRYQYSATNFLIALHNIYFLYLQRMSQWNQFRQRESCHPYLWERCLLQVGKQQASASSTSQHIPNRDSRETFGELSQHLQDDGKYSTTL